MFKTKINIPIEDEFSNPIDISDILEICKLYSNFNQKIQNEIDMIWEEGLQYSKDFIDNESLPFIIMYFEKISKNPLFGDATSQAKELIPQLSSLYKPSKHSKAN